MTPGIIGRRRFLLPLGIALLGLGINIVVAAYMAPTIDEPVHVGYGVRILLGNPDRPNLIYDSKMPVSALNALPRGIGLYLQDHRMAPGLAGFLRDFRVTRYATIAAAFCLSLLVFLFADALFGRTAGLFAQLLFVMDPNITAHSTVSTTDLYIAATTVLFLYCLRTFLLSPTTKNAALTAIALSIAQLTKFSALYLYFVLALVLAAAILYTRFGKEKRYSITWRQTGVLLALTAVFVLVAINAAFLFDKPFMTLAQYEFKSPGFQALQKVPVLRAVPIPLPHAYIQGLDWMNYHNITGKDFTNMSLLNEARGPELARSDGFPSYYLVAYGLKEPLGMQLLLVLGLVWIFRNRRPADLLAGEGPLLVTAGIFLILLSFFSRTQIGIRHILPVLVIFTILSGAAFQSWEKFSSRRKLLLGGCLAYAAISVASYFPNMIPYFNEIVTDRKLAYRYLADSNLDWGQGAWVVDRFLKNNPDVVMNPPQPVTGRVLVSGMFLAGNLPVKADYFLRRMDIRPVAQVAYSYFLFVVPEQAKTGMQSQKRAESQASNQPETP